MREGLLSDRSAARLRLHSQSNSSTAIAVCFFEIFKILAHPRLVAVAEVDEGGVAFAQVFVVIVHERCGRITVEPRNHLDILFEEIL